MRYLLILVSLLFLAGCTQEQVDRAEVAAQQAREYLARAKASEAKADEAVAIARALAEQVGSIEAKRAVEKAEAALAAVHATSEAASVASAMADAGVERAKAAQAAGGSTVDVLLAIAATLVPAAAAFIPLVKKVITTTTALRQTVVGLDTARNSLVEMDKLRDVTPGTTWDTAIAPALESAQDEKTKLAVVKVQKQAA